MKDRLIDNRTPHAAELLLALDGQGRELVAVLVQASYRIDSGKLVAADAARPIAMGGEWNGEPGASSYRLEPQVAPWKPGTDVVMLGHAYPRRAGDTQVDVGLAVGPVKKLVRVIGDRSWVPGTGGTPGRPRPFEKIPLIYEHAYGGADRRHPDPVRHRFERRNPLGRGFRPDPEEGGPLPNLEDPEHPYRTPQDTPPPAGFGFLAPDWLPRSRYAGTYDADWQAGRMPLPPLDFDPRFYNAAAPGLIAPSRLKGDEAVTVINASPDGRLAFALPGVPPPACRVEPRRGEAAVLRMELDTVVVDADRREVLLLWRGCTPLRGGLPGLRSIEVGGNSPAVAAPAGTRELAAEGRA